MENSTRRQVLKLCGVSMTAGVAGCLGDDDDDSDGGTRSDADTMLTIEGIDDVDGLPWDIETIGTFEGDGTAVSDSFSTEAGSVILVYEERDGTGLGADIVQVDGDGGMTLAINEVVFSNEANQLDTLTGARTAPLEGSGEYILEVDAESPWTTQVLKPSSPTEEVRTPPVSASGSGSAVMGPIDIEDGATVEVEYDDGPFSSSLNMGALPESADNWGFTTGDFIVTAEDPPFEGSARADVDGVSWIWLNGRHEWTVEVN